MRWIFALLVVGNGIYYYFQQYMVQPAQRQVVASVERVDLGQPLVLLQEASAAQLTPVNEPESLKPAVQAEGVMCWLLGPFKEDVSAKQVQGRLSALDVSFVLKETEVAGRPDYWVHVPPLANRKLAIKALRELQHKKIDSYLITEGELANGISLGLFTDQKRAERLFSKRKNEGLEVALKEVPRVYTELWLVSEQGEYNKFSDPLWEKIKVGQKGVERRKNYCNAVASPEKLD